MTRAEKISARNSLDHQTRVLEVEETKWMKKWTAAINPFVAWEQWKSDSSIRVAAYAPWIAAKNRVNLANKKL